MKSSRSNSSPLHRGFATAIVLWAVAITALALAALQLLASRQVAAGREAVARVRAHWAARAGLEATVARLQSEWEQSSPMGATTLLKDLATVGEGDLSQSKYRVIHSTTAGEEPGPSDTHAKININLMTAEDLLLLPDMSEEIASCIIDWIDADDDVSIGGAEIETYGSMPSSYRPRNGPVRSLLELELVKGVTPEMVRGEDWNQNGILDPNENDSDLSWPPDNADGKLDAGWSEFVTAGSITGGFDASGRERIDLTAADASELVQALSITDQQAQTIIAQVQQASGQMESFIQTGLSQLATTLQRNGQLTINTGRPAGRGGTQFVTVPDLSREQLAALLDQAQTAAPTQRTPGKINVNTADEQTLEYVTAITPTVRDALLLARDQNAGDIKSMTDLLDIPGLDAATVATLWRIMDTRSNVFTLTSRGRDEVSGIEIEITAEIDRSADPVVIRSMVVR